MDEGLAEYVGGVSKLDHRDYTVLVRREPLQLNADGTRQRTYVASVWNIDAAST